MSDLPRTMLNWFGESVAQLDRVTTVTSDVRGIARYLSTGTVITAKLSIGMCFLESPARARHEHLSPVSYRTCGSDH